MKKLLGLGLIAACMMVLAPVAGNAAVSEGQNSLEGSVVSISENLITVTNSSADDLRLTEVDVQVNKETEYEEGVSLSELKEGDTLLIEYKEDKEQKVATLIAKAQMDKE